MKISKILTSVYVCEFSPKQNMFHVCTVGEMISINSFALSKHRASDYIPFAIFLTEDAAHYCCRQYAALFKNNDLSNLIDINGEDA